MYTQQTSFSKLRSLAAGVLAVAAGLAATGTAAGPHPANGGIDTFAAVPAAPGFPEGVAVHGNHVFVSGPARFGTAGTGPSAIQVYDRKTGVLEKTVEVAGEALGFEHAVSNVATDCEGRLYALSTQLGLIRFTRQGQDYVQESYGAPLPDLPVCPADGQPCSPTENDYPPLPNDVVFDAQGNAYVTDSLQATLFRYPAGGGAPQIWFQSDDLEGGGFIPFGPNGIRIDPAGQYAYFVSSTYALDPALGTIYRLPLKEGNTETDLQVVHEYGQGEVPDQLAFGVNGDLYVSLAMTNRISVLKPDGSEKAVIQSSPNDAIPLDAPAGIAFDSRTKSLLIANHALLSGNPAHFAVLRAAVGDPGTPLVKPCPGQP
jgi:sugar lactone lactonase YvrE